MLTQQRRDAILGILRKDGSVNVTDLVKSFGVSDVTIRRDIGILADKGLANRVHGGATLPPMRSDSSRMGHASSPPRGLAMGMLVPSVAYYWPPVFTRAQSAAASLGHKLSLRCSGYGAVVEDRRQITRLLEGGARGLILAPTLAGPGSKELARWIHALPVPIVLIERTLATVSPAYLADSVSTDHELGTGLAVRHLAGQGHTRIGLLTSEGSPTSVKVRRGWLKALEELGLTEIADSHQSAPSSDVRSGYARVIDVLRERKLTAIVVHSDPEAIALMQHADEAGIRIPHDLAVVSYDDEVASASDPPLTAVRPPKAEIGALAVEMLVARMIQGESRPIHTTALTPRLIVRESCGASPLLAPSAS